MADIDCLQKFLNGTPLYSHQIHPIIDKQLWLAWPGPGWLEICLNRRVTRPICPSRENMSLQIGLVSRLKHSCSTRKEGKNISKCAKQLVNAQLSFSWPPSPEVFAPIARSQGSQLACCVGAVTEHTLMLSNTLRKCVQLLTKQTSLDGKAYKARKYKNIKSIDSPTS